MQKTVKILLQGSARILTGCSLLELAIYPTVRTALSVLSLSLNLVLIAVCTPPINAEGLLAEEFPRSSSGLA